MICVDFLQDYSLEDLKNFYSTNNDELLLDNEKIKFFINLDTQVFVVEDNKENSGKLDSIKIQGALLTTLFSVSTSNEIVINDKKGMGTKPIDKLNNYYEREVEKGKKINNITYHCVSTDKRRQGISLIIFNKILRIGQYIGVNMSYHISSRPIFGSSIPLEIKFLEPKKFSCKNVEKISPINYNETFKFYDEEKNKYKLCWNPDIEEWKRIIESANGLVGYDSDRKICSVVIYLINNHNNENLIEHKKINSYPIIIFNVGNLNAIANINYEKIKFYDNGSNNPTTYLTIYPSINISNFGYDKVKLLML